MTRMITVAIRYDDPSSKSSIEVERELINLFKKHNAVCTFGVIPYVTNGDSHDPASTGNLPLTNDKVKMLKEAVEDGIVDIALHGFEHKTIPTNKPGYTEFRGIEKDQQSIKIKQGKEYLEKTISTTISVFIPPWNSYDKNTISALDENNIGCVSASRHQPADNKTAVKFIPATMELNNPEDDIMLAISSARNSNDTNPNIVILMHQYDLIASGSNKGKFDYKQLGDMLEFIKNQKDVHLCSLSNLLEDSHEFDARRYMANQSSWTENIFPPFFSRTEQTPVYFSTHIARKNKIKKGVSTASLYISTFIFSSILGYFINNHIPHDAEIARKILLATIGLFTIFLIWRSYKKGAIYFRSFWLVVFSLGLIIGLVF